VTSRAELQGGNTQMLTAPMIGGAELFLTELRQPGEMVKKDDVVARFDTTEQIYRLREAEADLAEAEQKVLEAQFESEAKQEEDRLALLKARTELKLAELEARKNPLVAAIAARQNELAVEAASNHLEQLERDLADRKASSEAAIAIHRAARGKAQVQAAMAQRNIDSMTLKAGSDGYVSVQQNTNQNFFFMGMQLPLFQLGDSVRPGMAVAQIPDLSSWEFTARISELDRGHISPGQHAAVKMVSLPGRRFRATVKNLGSTVGPQWDRRFECKLGLEDPISELRPGMSADVIITTDTVKNALWLPAQALYESDGRAFVYLRKGDGFAPQDVKLVRRSESRVVVDGLAEGAEVALANPTEQNRRQKKGPGSAAQAMSKGKG
jgi:multidrug efflux pump subunit AcrA (membrane-fusion protein)